jgi:hypothetical protein
LRRRHFFPSIYIYVWTADIDAGHHKKRAIDFAEKSKNVCYSKEKDLSRQISE